MKILYITFDDLSRNFAWTTHVTEIIKCLEARGHEVKLALPWPENTLKQMGNMVYFKPLNRDLLFFSRVAAQFRPDVIYLRGIHLSFKPLIASFLLNRPLVIEINGLIEYIVTKRLVGALFKMLVPIYLRYSGGVITVSELFKKGLRAKGARLVHVVSNGVNLDRFKSVDKSQVREMLNLPDGIIGCFVGGFYPHHYLEFLVETVKKSNLNMTFLLVGDGPQKSFIQGLCNSLKNFVFVGEVPHDRVSLYMSASDFCVLTLKKMYRYYSPSPIKLYEYMACGRPVAVATDIPEIRDFTLERKIGLASGLDHDEFAKVLQQITIKSEDFGKNSQIAARDFTWEKSAEGLEKALYHVLRLDRI